MNIRESTQGNAYTKDSDYAAFTGRVVQTFTTTYYEPRLKAFVKRTVEYIDVGKPDRVTPVDSEELMTEESWDYEYQGVTEAVAAMKKAKVERDAVLLKEIKAHLATHGPMTPNQIAKGLGCARERVRDLLRDNRGDFVTFLDRHIFWGLPGQTHSKADHSKDGWLMIAIRDLLQERGQLTIAEMAQYLGSHPTTIRNSLLKRREWFVVAGIKPASGGTPASNIWQLAS